MSRVLLWRDAEGQLKGYRISGHTGFDEAGRDIVCAALSFLSITCANALESVAGCRPEIRQAEALLEVRVDSPKGQAATILKVFEQGIRDLKQAYPDHIDVQEQALLG